MTLNAKNLTSLAILTLVIGLTTWVSMHLMSKPEPARVGVVEVSDLP